LGPAPAGQGIRNELIKPCRMLRPLQCPALADTRMFGWPSPLSVRSNNRGVWHALDLLRARAMLGSV
jgi:hypothetical protein